MTDTEKREMLTAMTGEMDPRILSAYLSIAGDKILRRAYPFGNRPEAFPEEYDLKQIEIAVYLLNKRGAEGETAHSENGVSRSYEDGDIPSSMMRDILPSVSVIGGDIR